MYKKISLFVTFIICFVIFNGVVQAEEEYYCLYDGNQDCRHWYTFGINVCTQGMTLITYDDSGLKTYYTKDSISNYNELYNYPLNNSIRYDEDGVTLQSKKKCPKCVNVPTYNLNQHYVVAKYELNKNGECGNGWYPLISEDKKVLKENSTETYNKLECPYPGEKNLVISQSSSGKITSVFAKPETQKTFQFDNSDENTGYNKSTGKFDSCPQCAKIRSNEYVDFRNFTDKGKCPSGYSAYKSNDKNWVNTCQYNLNGNPSIGVRLYFNSTNYELVPFGSPHGEMSFKSDWQYYSLWNKNNGDCPPTIYSNYEEDSVAGTSTEKYSLESGDRTYTLTSSSGNGDSDDGEEYPEIDNCRDLFGSGVIEIINKVMNIIRIIVPILLLVFGSTDFFTAIFSDSEENMKSHRTRFFKRIVAAIIVFLVPVFVNVILQLANSVWSNIKSDTCVNSE